MPSVVRALSKALKLRGVLTRAGGELRALWGELPPPELSVKENGLELLATFTTVKRPVSFWTTATTAGRWNALRRAKACSTCSATQARFRSTRRGEAQPKLQVWTSPRQRLRTRGATSPATGSTPDAHAFLTADAFTLLSSYAERGEQFGVVVLDPPSLARNKKSRFAALRAYEKLNAQALRCVTPGGLLATASCTSQVSPEDFCNVLGEAAARAGRRVQVIHEAGHAPDHPVPASFPEGRYLKFVVARVL